MHLPKKKFLIIIFYISFILFLIEFLAYGIIKILNNKAVFYNQSQVKQSYEDYIKESNSNLQSDSSLKYIIGNYEFLRKNVNIRLLEAIQDRRVFSVEKILEGSKQVKYPVTVQNIDFFNAFHD